MRIRKSRLRWKECEKFIYEKNGVSVQGSWTGSGKLSTKYQCLTREGAGIGGGEAGTNSRSACTTRGVGGTSGIMGEGVMGHGALGDSGI